MIGPSEISIGGVYTSLLIACRRSLLIFAGEFFYLYSVSATYPISPSPTIFNSTTYKKSEANNLQDTTHYREWLGRSGQISNFRISTSFGPE
jgi:hypothetical protein